VRRVVASGSFGKRVDYTLSQASIRSLVRAAEREDVPEDFVIRDRAIG
jgi:hypothetical protein